MSRLFDEKQIGAILKRAAEMDGAKDPANNFGLSLQELQQLATETGLSPESIAAAVAELDVSVEDETHTWWGGPLSLMVERTVNGEVNDEVWERMVSEIRRAFKDTGHQHTFGQGYEWRHGGSAASGTKAHVTATPRDGRTRIEVFWNEPTMAAPFYVISGILSIILAPVLFESLGLFTPAGVAFYLGLISSILFLSRWMLMQTADREKRNVRQLMAKLEQIATEAAPRLETTAVEALAQETTTTEPLLPLDEESEASEQEQPIKQNRQRT